MISRLCFLVRLGSDNQLANISPGDAWQGMPTPKEQQAPSRSARTTPCPAYAVGKGQVEPQPIKQQTHLQQARRIVRQRVDDNIELVGVAGAGEKFPGKLLETRLRMGRQLL